MTSENPHDSVVLSARGVGKSFGAIRALDDVGLDLRAGEVHAVMGENGAGKSTLMRILTGVVGEHDGQLEVDGHPCRFGSVREAEARGVVIIHQELNLVPDLTIAENVFLGREPLRWGLVVDRHACLAEARRILDDLGLKLDPTARTGDLRVGEQQLVEIARALSIQARVLIMDEPTSALTPAECKHLFAIIAKLRADGVAIAYISHRIDEVMALADRVTVLRDGRHVTTRPIALMDADAIIAAMVGRDLSGFKVTRPLPKGEVVLSVQDLSLTRPDRGVVVRGVSFDLRRGEVLGVGGLLGAGRSEVLLSLFGAGKGRVGGQIMLDGCPVAIGSPRDAMSLGFGLVTEDRKAEGLLLRDSIADNVTLPQVGQLARLGVRGLRAEQRMADRAVSDLGIRCDGPRQAVGMLSGGNQQKVVMAKWLATEPRILLLDEPTRGIDVGAKREIYDLIFHLADAGLSLIVVSSELPELLLLSDRVLVLSEGRQTGILSRAEASETAIMRLAAPRAAQVMA